ncbi:MAG: rhodanese-like domain-containing protein [Pseudomonadota bacterium]
MKLNVFFAALIVSGLSACTMANDSFDIRSPDRPEYTQTISPEDVSSFLSDGGILVDARLSEDFEKDPDLIPGAIRVDPENTDFWKSAQRDVPVAVYCVKGKWVSQKQASYISSLGFEAYSLDGGLVAFQAYSEASD